MRIRHIAKSLGIVLGALLCLLVLHALLVFFPQPLFRHHLTYRNFTVRSTEEIPEKMKSVLDRVASLLAASELDDTSLHHRVYLLNSYRLMRLLLFSNVHFGANLPNGSTFIIRADVSNDLARCKRLGPGDNRLRTLSGSIVHEITHHLIRRKIGFWQELRDQKKRPVWYKEGYCDFIARDSAIDMELGIAIMTGSHWPVPGYANFRSRLLIDHLLSEKGKTFAEILAQPPDDREITVEVVKRLRRDPGPILERLRQRVD